MIRVAVIGAGVGAAHAWSFRQLPDDYELVALCDLDGDKAARVLARIGADDVAITTSIEEVLASDVELVSVCLPPHLHAPVSIAALNAGKHLICEKPLVTSLADADRVIDAAERAGTVASPIFQYRYGIGMSQFRAVEGAGMLGRPFAATLETHWNRGAAYYAVPWRGRWATEGGGALIGHAIHIHDLLSALMGPVASVFARLDTLVNPIETEDCGSLSIRMRSGALVTSSITLGAATDESRLRLLFDGATIESDHEPYAPCSKPWTFIARDPDAQAAMDDVVAGVTAPPDLYVGQFAQVARAIEGRPCEMVTLADGRASIEFATAVYESSRTGRDVTLPLDPDHPLRDGWVPSTTREVPPDA
jgi:predicted dehydrogenase